MKDISEMSQFDYERLLNAVAGVLRAQRRFITIESEKLVAPHTVRYKVKRRGAYNRYLVSASDFSGRIVAKNMGVII